MAILNVRLRPGLFLQCFWAMNLVNTRSIKSAHQYYSFLANHGVAFQLFLGDLIYRGYLIYYRQPGNCSGMFSGVIQKRDLIY